MRTGMMLVGATLVLWACSDATAPPQHVAAMTGSHIAGVAPIGPMTVISANDLTRHGAISVGAGLADSAASPDLTISGH